MKAFCTFVIVTLISCRVTSGQEPIAALEGCSADHGYGYGIQYFREMLGTSDDSENHLGGSWCEKAEDRMAEVASQVDETLLQLTMDCRPSSQISDDAQNRIVDLKGRRLDRDEIGKRLKAKTPVLVSVSGRMPDEFYLQCTTPDTLIVILGVPDSLAPQFCHAKPKITND
ncbi:MAG: hypothetical protein U0905_17780 [Pirellulales bacterium]